MHDGGDADILVARDKPQDGRVHLVQVRRYRVQRAVVRLFGLFVNAPNQVREVKEKNEE